LADDDAAVSAAAVIATKGMLARREAEHACDGATIILLIPACINPDLSFRRACAARESGIQTAVPKKVDSGFAPRGARPGTTVILSRLGMTGGLRVCALRRTPKATSQIIRL
jgi:hypothetical protein